MTSKAKGMKRRGFAASKAQREKIALAPFCIACGSTNSEWRKCDPAHLWPRGMGGCDDEDCVVPLCRFCHGMYDEGSLDLLPSLEPEFRLEVAHMVHHAGLESARRRLAPNLYRQERETDAA